MEIRVVQEKRRRLVEGRKEGEPAPCLVDFRWHILERKKDQENENNLKYNMEEKEQGKGNKQENPDNMIVVTVFPIGGWTWFEFET